MLTAWETFVNQFITKGGYELALDGLKNTAIIAVFGLVIGFVIGSLLALIKLIPTKMTIAKVPSAIADVYVALFRGTPMVVQLLIIHFVLFPFLGINIDGVTEAVIVFGMNSGAYMCEVMRGGILSVDKGQNEAGRALGLGYGKTMIKIIIPQAIKNVVPTLGNEFIALIKETSVVSFIAVVDVTKAFKAIADSTYEYIVPYLMLAVVYLVLVLVITALIKLVEWRFRASDRN